MLRLKIILATCLFGWAQWCFGVEMIDVSRELEGFLQDGKIPALAAAAVLDGEIIAAGAVGVRKFGESATVTMGDKFHIGSCTKSMTGVLAAILVADGKVRWDTTVQEVFPEMEMDAGYREATLQQFLSNTGGAPQEIPISIWQRAVENREGSEVQQRRDFAQALLAIAPAYAPGGGNIYSNGGFTIAGAMLEQVVGESYQQLISKHLFQPLKMQHAGFGVAATPGKVDQPYGHLLRDGIPYPISPGPEADNPPAITPAGRVHLSVLDLARYANFQLGTMKDAPLDQKSLEFLHTVVPPAEDYAIGWLVLERAWAHGVALHHSGSNTMNFTVIWLAPKRKFGVVVTCNIASGIGEKACDEAASYLIQRFLKQ